MAKLGSRFAVVTMVTVGVVTAVSTPAAAFITPILGMDCSTWITQKTSGGYEGNARCITSGTAVGWMKIRVDCTFGWSTVSAIPVPVPVGAGEVVKATWGDCWFGVNSIWILESREWVDGPYHTSGPHHSVG